MRPDVTYVPESLGELLSILWAAIPVNGYLITSIVAGAVFCVALIWKKLGRANAN